MKVDRNWASSLRGKYARQSPITAPNSHSEGGGGKSNENLRKNIYCMMKYHVQWVSLSTPYSYATRLQQMRNNIRVTFCNIYIALLGDFFLNIRRNRFERPLNRQLKMDVRPNTGA
jgi:hypothetical protein